MEFTSDLALILAAAAIGASWLDDQDDLDSKAITRDRQGRFARGGNRSHQNPAKVRDAAHAGILKHQTGERREHAHDIRKERGALRTEHHAERRTLKRRHAREDAKLENGQDREFSKLSRQHDRERAKNPSPAVRGRHAEERQSLVREHVDEREAQAGEHRTERRNLAEEHREARASQRETHRESIAELRGNQRTELAEHHRDVRSQAEYDREQTGKGLAPDDIATKDKRPPEDEGDEPNTYDLPSGEDIARRLRRFFGIQARRVLGVIATIGEALPEEGDLPDLGEDDERMARAFTPLISSYWDRGAKEIRGKLGLEPSAWHDSWHVSDPHVKDKIDRAAMAFCASTNSTTSDTLANALSRLRDELKEGVVDEGEGVAELTKRVQSVFDTAEKFRARRIAATEASRAVHDAQYASVEDTGVVQGLKILVSAGSCSLCQRLASEVKQVALGQNIAVIGNHPDYMNIKTAPFHPNCRCSVTYVLTEEFGGPANPEWGATLIQPTADEDYKPPDGKPAPKPEPEAVQPQAVTKKPDLAKPESARTPKERIANAADYAAKYDVPVIRKGADLLGDAVHGDALERTPAGFVYSKTAQVIAINPEHHYWSDPSEYMKRSKASGWLSSDNVNHPMTHEIGHALHYKAVGHEDFNYYRDAPMSPKQVALVTSEVSRYAATSGIEFVAEVYAGRVHGKTYPESILKLYREYKGPRTVTIFPQCFGCRHFNKEKDRTKPLTCDAFSDGDGIPKDILLGEHDHTKSYNGDHGILFEPLDEEPEA